jgi:hypothetical protein
VPTKVQALLRHRASFSDWLTSLSSAVALFACWMAPAP